MFGFKNKPPAAPRLPPKSRQKSAAVPAPARQVEQGRPWLTYDLANLIPGGKIDATVLDELEMRLITADVGVDTTERILTALRKKARAQ